MATKNTVNQILLQRLIDTIPNPIYYKDQDFRYQFCNEAFCRDVFGLKKSEVIGRTLDQIYNDTVVSSIKKKDIELLKDKKDQALQQTYEKPIRYADGKIRLIRFNKAVYRDSDGNLLGIVGVMEDITEIREAEEKIKQLNKKLDLKVKRIDKERIMLTDNEKLSLYGLVRYPNLTIKALAKKLNINQITLNTIKNRLKKEGYYRSLYYPNFAMLGMGILSFNYYIDMTEDGKRGISQKSLKDLSLRLNKNPLVAFSLSTKNDALVVTIAKDWHEYKKMKERFESVLKEKGIRSRKSESIPMDLKTITTYSFYRFDMIVKNVFELDIDEKPLEVIRPSNPARLSKKEIKVLVGLIKFPDNSIESLSHLIGVSVPTICKARKKMLEQGILKIINYPYFEKIGIKFLVFSYYRNLPMDELSIKPLDSDYYSIASHNDFLRVSLFKDYTDIKADSEMNDFFKDKDVIDSPVSIVFPLELVKFRKFNVEKITEEIVRNYN